MKSMTGYGKYIHEIDGRRLMIELKSVNHRFLDLNIKLPRIHNYVESIVRKGITNAITRGHIDVYITYTDDRDKKIELVLDEDLAKTYLSIAQTLSNKYNIVNDYTVTSLIKSTDVITETIIEDDEEIINILYSECIDKAVKNLNIMREAEGLAIKSEIKDRISIIQKSLDIIRERAPKVFSEYKIKLEERINEALNDIAVDESKLLNEVAFYADKCAIDEEISRLSTHIDNFQILIESNEPNGRKIDFLIQEMNRESNTINSKANDIIIVNEVLKLKSEIEKIREQIQNIE